MLLAKHTDLVISPVPFQIVPIEVKMLWSPLLHHANSVAAQRATCLCRYGG